jgi:uncharacterized protein (DUF1684 family)
MRPTDPTSTAPDASAQDQRVEKLQLADWRRRISELYAEVRKLASTDPAAAWDHLRLIRERLYREHPSSPVTPDSRAAFVAGHFTYDPNLRFELPVRPTEMSETADRAGEGRAVSGSASGSGSGPDLATRLGRGLGAGLALPISVGQPISFDRVGWLDVPFASGVRRLALFWLPEYSGGFFLPFRDATNGAATYGGGRYLIDSAKGADLGGDPARGTVIVDFNFAYHPSCAFDPRWSCPLSPPENRLDIEVRTGELLR